MNLGKHYKQKVQVRSTSTNCTRCWTSLRLVRILILISNFKRGCDIDGRLGTSPNPEDQAHGVVHLPNSEFGGKRVVAISGGRRHSAAVTGTYPLFTLANPFRGWQTLCLVQILILQFTNPIQGI